MRGPGRSLRFSYSARPGSIGQDADEDGGVDAAALQGFEGQGRVVEGAEPGSGDHDGRAAEFHGEVASGPAAFAELDEQAAGAFEQDHLGLRFEDRLGDLVEVEQRQAAAARGGEGRQGIGVEGEGAGRCAGEAGDLGGVVIVAGLGELDDLDAAALPHQVGGERGRGDGLADPGIGAGHQDRSFEGDHPDNVTAGPTTRRAPGVVGMNCMTRSNVVPVWECGLFRLVGGGCGWEGARPISPSRHRRGRRPEPSQRPTALDRQPRSAIARCPAAQRPERPSGPAAQLRPQRPSGPAAQRRPTAYLHRSHHSERPVEFGRVDPGVDRDPQARAMVRCGRRAKQPTATPSAAHRSAHPVAARASPAGGESTPAAGTATPSSSAARAARRASSLLALSDPLAIASAAPAPAMTAGGGAVSKMNVRPVSCRWRRSTAGPATTPPAAPRAFESVAVMTMPGSPASPAAATPPAPAADRADRVGLVDQEQRAVGGVKAGVRGAGPRRRGRVDRLDGDERGPQRPELAFEVVEVVVRERVRTASREADRVVERRVGVGVEQDRPGQRGDRAEVGHVARGVQDRGLGAGVAGEVRLEGLMDAGGAAHEAGVAGAEPVSASAAAAAVRTPGGGRARGSRSRPGRSRGTGPGGAGESGLGAEVALRANRFQMSAARPAPGSAASVRGPPGAATASCLVTGCAPSTVLMR